VNNMTDEKYYSVVDELNSLRSENQALKAENHLHLMTDIDQIKELDKRWMTIDEMQTQWMELMDETTKQNCEILELIAQVAGLTAIVEAYRLAGKWAELGTNCHDCPVRFGTCGTNKKPACQHPSEYEAEWLKASEQK